MTNHMKFGIGGIIIGLILLAVLPWYVSVLIIAAAIALPTAAYLMLDPSQRRRLREQRRRRQLGSR
jgi:membrane protein implicated in regulation of membrane protease activity